MNPFYQDALITLYNTDCMEGMKATPDKNYDLCIVDPPYGLDEGNKVISRSERGVIQKNGSIRFIKTLHVPKDWDKKPPPQCYFDELFRVSKKQIIFGENYLQFNQKDQSSGRIFWDKVNGDSDFSDGELLWTNIFQSVRQIDFLWNGMLQAKSFNEPRTIQGNIKLKERRIHPSQKPVALYKCLLQRYAKQGDKILDTHFGSGSIGVACSDLGFKLTAFEIDDDYCKAATQRIENYKLQQILFNPSDFVD